MSLRHPWSTLGIAETHDVKAIRKAYADAVKAMDLDADVQGYARLRNARDMALRLAKTRSADPEPEEPLEPPAPLAQTPDDPVARWEHAAPDLPGDWTPDARLSTRPRETQDDTRIVRPFARTMPDGGAGEAIALPRGIDLSPPLLEGYGPTEAALGLTPGQSPFERLAELLDPENEAIAGLPFDDAEEIVARRAMRAIIDIARMADVSQQGRIEVWLAERLAESWPRSAPLLEAATEAFAWEREWGRFDARPVIEYLGSRLRGYRFQSKVAEANHRFHKAWCELSRPGKAGPLRFLRASTADVQGLLAGIRKHFPELEEHLDAERVASWETTRPLSATTIVMLVVFALFAVAVAIGGSDPGRRSSGSISGDPLAPAMVPASTQQDTEVSDTIKTAIIEVFGEGRDINWLLQHQPDLEQTIASNVRITLQNGEGRKAAIGKALEIVRERVYRNGRELSGADFTTTMELRLGLLKAARKQGTDTCISAMNSSWLDHTIPVPDSLREQERRFASALAEKGILKVPERSQATTASVPGPLVGQVIDATKLPEDRVRKAMGGAGSDADNCAVAIALLERTLAWKGEGRRAILRTL